MYSVKYDYTVNYNVINAAVYYIGYILYNIHCTQYIIYCTLYTTQYTLYTVHITLCGSVYELAIQTSA